MTTTLTQQLQQYVNEIYGEGFYKIEYQVFKGFYAVSQPEDIPPHSQFLGLSSSHANAHLDSMADIKELQFSSEVNQEMDLL